MGSNNNFLLKIHIKNDDGLTEIFLNKERHSFTFFNDDCLQDLMIPENEIIAINKELENVKDSTSSDDYYMEYERDNTTVRECDHDKIEKVKNMVTHISLNDFIDYIDVIRINDYYIDNIIKSYNCTLPIEVKKILSYTTNGVSFDGDSKMAILSHDAIVEYKGPIKNFIPIMVRDDNVYIGYDHKENLFKEYSGELVINAAPTFKELMEKDLSMREEKKTSEEREVEEDVSIVEAEDAQPKYDDTLKNIDYQLERLTSSIADDGEKNEDENTQKEEKVPINNIYVVSDEVRQEVSAVLDKIQKEEQENIRREIVEGVRKSLSEIEDTNSLIDEIDSNIGNVNLEKPVKKDNDSSNLNTLINNSLFATFDNYKINFNDTQKLVIEHLPYYEFSSGFEVIQIPEIELDKLTLLPGDEIDLGKIKLAVDSLSDNSVDLVVKASSSITIKDGDKLKKGSHIALDLQSEVTLLLDKKNAMETWSIKMEKSTFEKELRNIDYNKIMKLITGLDSYKKLCNIEKYELEKSIMLFINFVMEYHEEKALDELYRILVEEPTLYEEYVTKYNMKHSQEMKDYLPTYEQKKAYVEKYNYISGLIEAKWLDYPRYIFESQKYFDNDYLLEEFIAELNDGLKEKDFSDYLHKLFKEYKMFSDLDETGKDNLNRCLEYLSVLYKYNPSRGEENKYRIEKEFMIGADEESMSLLISKICRRGIKDYSVFVEYDAMLKEMYRLGELHYPIFSPSFGLDDIRNGGEYDEY